jgi:hypothetical protein
MMAIKVVAVCSTNVRDEKCMRDFGQKQEDNLKDLAVEGTTLKLILHKYIQRMSSGFIWLKSDTSDWLL